MRAVSSASPFPCELGHLGPLATTLAQQRELVLHLGSRSLSCLLHGSVRALMRRKGPRSLAVQPASRTPTLPRTSRIGHAAAARLEVRRQLAPHVGLPDLRHVSRAPHQARVVAREEEAQVLQVPLEEEFRPTVGRRRDGLRKVDDRGAVRAEQDVVGAQVPVDEIAAEYLHRLLPQIPVELRGKFWREHRVHETRRGLALGVHHQLHQQHALVKHHRRGHPHPGCMQLGERLGLGRLPGLLLGLLPKAAALLHGPPRAAVANEAPLFVARVVLEVALGALLVDLRRHVLAAMRRDVDVRLLATLEASNDLINHAIREKDFERCVHMSLCVP
jgi:hypothetical protein